MPVEQKIAHILLKRHGAVERVPARYRQRQPQRDSRSLRLHMQRLARHLAQDDTPRGGTLRVRLHEEREHGMGW